jgi:hypothetical protein
VGGTRIVGITLVRDEDLFVEQAVRNALEACDEVIVLEHRSIDRTPEILDRLAAERPAVRVHRIGDPRESHDYVAGYAGEDVWIAGFDGDQLFDSAGLRAVRARILDGELDGFWSVTGRGVNCVEVDTEAGTASGYHAPPSRGTPKLFNFAAIEAWEGPTPERLHGGTIRFRPGYDGDRRSDELQRLAWDETPLRWLHLCFVRRSSRRPETTRLNPAEEAGRREPRERLRHGAARLLGRPAAQGKVEAYSRGPLETVDARPFFAPALRA